MNFTPCFPCPLGPFNCIVLPYSFFFLLPNQFIVPFILRDETVPIETDHTHVAANALEAVIGAIYLDGGMETADNVLAHLLFPEKVRDQMS